VRAASTVAEPASQPPAASPASQPPATRSVSSPAVSTESTAAAAEPDLAEDKRRRVDDLHVVVGLLDHYQVLGIDRSADRAKVKSAYFEFSKQFHPDTVFRKSVGPYRQKMEVIFKRLTEAYDVLSKKNLREEYDAGLARTEGSQPYGNPAVLPASPPHGTPVAPTAPPPSLPIPPVDEETKRRAQELLARRLDAVRQPSHRPAPPSTLPSVPKPASKGEVIRELAASLKGAAKLTGGFDAVQRQVIDARRSLADGQLSEAVRKLRLARAMSPDDAQLRLEHDGLVRELAASLADKHAEQAANEERQQKWAAAAVSWQKVVDGRPGEARCHWRCAKALLESAGDAKRAVRLAQRAVELEPNNVFAIRTLGRAFMVAGLSLNAKRELERAIALDPNDEASKALLKEPLLVHR
jgi:tetratricopeptide (TPR) repeat protein